MLALHLVPLAAPSATDVSASFDDPMLSFAAESDLAHALLPLPTPARNVPVAVKLAASGIMLAVVLLVGSAVSQARRSGDGPPLPPVTTGTINITSEPAGAPITVDGEPRGETPLQLLLPVGPHSVDVISGGVSRTLPIAVEAGAVLSQHIEFVQHVMSDGVRLQMATDTPTARADVDGVPGGTPAPTSESAKAGADADIPVASTAAGWVRITAPIELQIFEAGRLIGTTAGDRLKIAPGRHTLDVVNEPFEFRATIRVDVVAGRTATAPIALPNGTLSINASPWAEVSIDGRPAGLTPLGNLSVPIGPHEVMWRHPRLGERLQTVVVTAISRVGVGTDLTK